MLRRWAPRTSTAMLVLRGEVFSPWVWAREQKHEIGDVTEATNRFLVVC